MQGLAESQLRQAEKAVTGGGEVWELRGLGAGKVISKDTSPSQNSEWSGMGFGELAVMAVRDGCPDFHREGGQCYRLRAIGQAVCRGGGGGTTPEPTRPCSLAGAVSRGARAQPGVGPVEMGGCRQAEETGLLVAESWVPEQEMGPSGTRAGVLATGLRAGCGRLATPCRGGPRVPSGVRAALGSAVGPGSLLGPGQVTELLGSHSSSALRGRRWNEVGPGACTGRSGTVKNSQKPGLEGEDALYCPIWGSPFFLF